MSGEALRMAERLPRYRREPKRFKGSLLSAVDWQLIEAVGLHRVVQSHHLDQLLPDVNADHVRRRLQQLFHTGYLDRPDAQKALTGSHEGSASMVHTLTAAGARLLADEHGLEVRPRKPGGELTQLKHDLATTDFLVSLAVDCAQSKNLELVHFAELLRELPEPGRLEANRGGWRVVVTFAGYQRSVHPRPDAIFAIANRKVDPPKNRVFHFLETDRESMPIIPRVGEQAGQRVGYSPLDKPTIVRKFLQYTVTLERGLHQQLFGMPNIRIVLFCKTRARVESMIAAHREHVRAFPQQYLFIDRETLLASGEPFYRLSWKNAAGATVKFFDNI